MKYIFLNDYNRMATKGKSGIGTIGFGRQIPSIPQQGGADKKMIRIMRERRRERGEKKEQLERQKRIAQCKRLEKQNLEKREKREILEKREKREKCEILEKKEQRNQKNKDVQKLIINVNVNPPKKTIPLNNEKKSSQNDIASKKLALYINKIEQTTGKKVKII
jgi:hypothetical protein